MAVLPALMLLNGDLDCKAKFTFGDLASSVFASLDLATSTVVGGHIWIMISMMEGRATDLQCLPTRYTPMIAVWRKSDMPVGMTGQNYLRAQLF